MWIRECTPDGRRRRRGRRELRRTAPGDSSGSARTARIPSLRRRATTRSRRCASRGRVRAAARRAPAGLGARWETPTSSSRAIPSSSVGVRFALFHLMAPPRTAARRPSAPAGSPAPRTAATCSGTPTSSSCRSSPRRTRRPPARCSSTGCAGSTARARRRARSAAAGARFPWESARDGGDVTPKHARDQTGAPDPDPHRRARGAHRRRRRLGGLLLRGLDRRRGVPARAPGASCSSRRRATGPRAIRSTTTAAATSTA